MKKNEMDLETYLQELYEATIGITLLRINLYRSSLRLDNSQKKHSYYVEIYSDIDLSFGGKVGRNGYSSESFLEAVKIAISNIKDQANLCKEKTDSKKEDLLLGKFLSVLEKF